MEQAMIWYLHFSPSPPSFLGCSDIFMATEILQLSQNELVSQ